MTYRSIRPRYGTGNSVENKLARYKFALTLLEVFEKRLEIVNIDESSIDHLDFKRKGWFFKHQSFHIEKTTSIKRISITACITSTGQIFYSMHAEVNNQKTTVCFLFHLFKVFDDLDPNGATSRY